MHHIGNFPMALGFKLSYRAPLEFLSAISFFKRSFFMRIKSTLTLSLIAAATLLVACGKKEEAAPAPAAAPAAAPAPASNVIKIGHVGPTSGAIAHLGKDNENGARMAIEELNAAGVMIGGKKVTFELLAEDDAADPKQGTAVAQKLVDAKVSGVVGHLNSGTTIPASKIYSDAGLPQVSPSATNPKYTRQGFKTTFRMVADDTQLGGTLGKYAVATLKGKSIAVIDDRTAYGQGVAEEFAKAVEAAGGKIVAKEFTTDKATDFTSILTTIKSKKPDVVFFGGMDAVAGPMLKQMKSLAIKAKFMGGDGICSTELVKLGGDAIADNQVYCAEAGGVEGESKVGMEEFKTKFKAKYNADVQVYAPYVYDAVKIMVAAMVKADSSDPAKYLPALAATADYKGVTGPVTFDEKGDIKNGALTLKTVRGGKLETLAVIR
jgi:branched-chain amino acid transport system substrate-binding protein